MAAPTTMYYVFKADVDNEGHLHWDFAFGVNTIERAKEIIAKSTEGTWDPVHPDMTKENNYTFVGTRTECSKGYILEDHDYPDDVMGWVIEAQTLQ